MAKLITYRQINDLPDGIEFVGLIPANSTDFETVRATREAVRQFILTVVPTIKGDDGVPVELRANTTHIQWRYVGAAEWINIVALADLKGDKGDAGKRIVLQKNATHIQWGYFGEDTWTNLVALTDLQGPPGQAGAGLTNRDTWVSGTTYVPGDYVFAPGSSTSSSMWILRGNAEYVSTIAPKDDLTHWVEFVAPAGKDGENGNDGTDGRSVELQKTSDAIQWRWTTGADLTWKHLILLTEIKGNQGDIGPAGSKWFTGTDVPASSLGVNSDMYLRSNGDVYGPKSAGSWGSVIGNLKGTKGDTGPGVPVGGTTGQMLVKVSATDFDTKWADVPTGGGGSSDAVLLTGDQTVGGNKTWTGRSYFGAKPTSPAPPPDPAGLMLGVWGPALFAGSTEFRLMANLQAGYKMPAIISATPASGVVTLAAYNLQQKVDISANTAALTLKLPDASGNSSGSIYEVIPSGAIFRVFFPYDVAALTVQPGKNTYWYADAVLRGAPTSVKAGVMEIQYFSTGEWFFLPQPQSVPRSTYLYPGGGNAASPGNVNVNTTYPLDNPYPDSPVVLRVQLLVSGAWEEPGWLATPSSTTDNYGVKVTLRDVNQIIVQTATAGLSVSGNFDGGSRPRGTATISAPTPCRVQVVKL